MTIDLSGPITVLYAWVGQEPDGVEGILAYQIEGLGWMPMVSRSKEKAEDFRSKAETISKMTGHPVRMKTFRLVHDA